MRRRAAWTDLDDSERSLVTEPGSRSYGSRSWGPVRMALGAREADPRLPGAGEGRGTWGVSGGFLFEIMKMFWN